MAGWLVCGLGDEGGAEFLGEVGLAVGPGEDPLHDVGALSGVGGFKDVLEGVEFGEGEVAEVDVGADVVRGATPVADQVGGAGDTEQDEGQPLEEGVGGPRVVRGPDGGEEVIGESHAKGGIDFVNEDDDGGWRPRGGLGFRQDDVAEEVAEALDGVLGGVVFPPMGEIDIEVELDGEFVEEAEEPFFRGGDAAAEGADVEDGGTDARALQVERGADHERGFPHLPCGEDVAVFACEGELQEFVIDGARDVGGGFAPKRAACDEEFLGRGGGFHGMGFFYRKER